MRINEKRKNSIVLVTGANGFLGSTIVQLLQKANFCVRATDIGDSSVITGVEYQKANILHPDELSYTLCGVATVIHAAGLAHIFSDAVGEYKKFHRINTIGTKNVVRAAAKEGVKHFILISTVSVYGQNTAGLCGENLPPRPKGPYAISKYNSEVVATGCTRKSEMALTILRLSTLYGEGDPGNIRRLIRAMDLNRFVWIGDCSNRKSLLYKGDAARACKAVVELPATGTHIYNVSATPCTMRQIVEGVAEALQKNALPLKIPTKLALVLSRCLSKIPTKKLKTFHQTVRKWIAEDAYDSQLFNQAFGFSCKTSIKEGIQKEVDWYLSQK